jgi:tetratricopeptide (TPR) repeat protein
MALGLASGHALGSSPAEGIRQALVSGQLEQAAKLVLQEKQRQPQDTEIRFLEGVIQAQQGQTDKAIETFRKLVESSPGLVEAHNNLGVLYAAKGRLEDARKALEAGMLANASYAALHRNLADVQSQLVKQTYAKALQVDSKSRSAVAQLSLLASMQSRASGPSVEALPPMAAAASRPQPTPATPVASVAPSASAASAAAVSPPAPTTRPTASAATPVASVPTAQTVAEAAQTTRPSAEVRPKPSASVADAAEAEAVRSAVLAWAKAWSRRDMNEYLQSYASNFVPAERLSRSQWEAERKQRILSKKSISVEIRQLKVKVEDRTATVQFQQVYSSDNFTGTSRKTLEMVKQGGRWLIVRETVS